MHSGVNNNQSPGKLVSIITFNVRATQPADTGFIPWINIGKANEEILNLADADEVVIKEQEITIFMDFPLSEPTSFHLFSSIGFSRKFLLIEIREKFLALSKEGSFDINGLDLIALDVYETTHGNIEVILEIDM